MNNKSASENTKQLHQTVIDVIKQVKIISKNHENKEDEEQTFREKISDKIFSVGSSWTPILLFSSVIILWVGYNILASAKYRFDPFPFSLITFLLAGVAAIQAPFIMMSQHWQNEKNLKIIALNLKVENEIIALHQSITITMEQQLQQVLENQAFTISLLQELKTRSNSQANPVQNPLNPATD